MKNIALIQISTIFLLLFSCRKDPVPPQVSPPYNGPALCKTQLEQISVPANNMDTTVYNVGCGAIPEANQLFAEYLYTDAVFNPLNVNQIAYIREKTTQVGGSGIRELWTYDFCTGNSQKICENVANRFYWGKNGWILFSRNLGSLNFQLFKIRPDGSQLTQLTDLGVTQVAVPYPWNRNNNEFIFSSSIQGVGYFLLTADENGNITDTIHDFANGMMFVADWLNGDTLLTSKTPTGIINPSLYLYNSGVEVPYYNSGGVSRIRIFSDLSFMICQRSNGISKSSTTDQTILRTGASNRSYTSLDLSADNQYILFSRHNERNPTPCDLYHEDKIYIMSTDGSYERELILP